VPPSWLGLALCWQRVKKWAASHLATIFQLLHAN
jgi:hypothetical protein